MAIKKKSKETLEQQKNSFLNFVGTQKKYESIIAELFLMDNEKIDDIEYIKTYLTGKGIDKELIDNFENDYKKYLGCNYFYGPINQYPPELQSKIIKNNKILEKLKKEIIEDYNKINDFDLFVSNKKFEEFLTTEIGYEESNFNSRNIDSDISDIKLKLKEKQDALKSKEQLLEQKEKEYAESKFLSIIKKFKLKKEIGLLKDEIILFENELSLLKIEHNELYDVKRLLNGISYYKENVIEKRWGYKNYSSYEYEWDPVLEFIGLEKGYGDSTEVFNESFDFSESGQNNYKVYCKDYLSKIAGKLKLCSLYIPYEDFHKYIINSLCLKRKSHTIYGPVKDCIDSLETKINEYLNYFFFGENKGIDCIRKHRWISTVFSGEKIDENILNVINVLKNFEADFSIDGIDERFINDIFIHKSDFRVLDEILKDGGLISHNEILNRRGSNEDIKLSSMSHNNPHKDIYFSRGFNEHNYGLSSKLEDKVFYVNTMNNFALSGYGVPLNLCMQGDTSMEECHYSDDGTGFSIISNSSLNGKYGKIDIKDLFIFVSETKKSIIESNPNNYPVGNAHIIYIPKELYTGQNYTYKIYEFIEQEMEQFNQNKKIVPYRIIGNNEDNIHSTGGNYLWAFCEEIGSDNIENNVTNLLGDGNVDNLLTILKMASIEDNLGFIDKIKHGVKNADFDNLLLPEYFPVELFKLLYIYLKIENNHRPNVGKIGTILSKSGYSQRKIAIFIEIARNYGKISYYDFEPFCDAFNLDYDNSVKIILLKLRELLKK